MKKILISILTFLGIGLSFCSADILGVYNPFLKSTQFPDGQHNITYPDGYNCLSFSCSNCDMTFYDSDDNLLGNWVNNSLVCNASYFIKSGGSTSFSTRYFNIDFSGGSSSSCPDQLIDVQYNSGNITTITCDGINYITIDGLSTLTNSNVNYEYTPYFNIDYKDEDNQSLIESYDKYILYLSGGLFKKTYTGNNDWILTVQGGNSDNSFSGYLPTFDITGGIYEVSTSGNIFNNFAENSLKFTLSNIPSYIQYVIIIMLLLFVLGFIRKFKRR